MDNACLSGLKSKYNVIVFQLTGGNVQFFLLMEYTLVNVKEKIFWSALKNSTLGEEGTCSQIDLDFCWESTFKGRYWIG